MYSYIRGELVEIIDENWIVLEANQIGYNIRISAQTLEYLPGIGSEVKIYTYLYVKEDAHMLYGFLTRDDLEIFRLLIGVSGIGPKGALAILSALSSDDLRFAVLTADAKTIAKAPGVGNKTAQRIIIELKDKLRLEDTLAQINSKNAIEPENNVVRKSEAVEALVSLGYSAAEARKVLQGIEITEETPVEEILKEALKALAFL